MQMDNTVQQGVLVLTPAITRLDAAVANSFKQAAHAALAVHTGMPVVIDMQAVDFVDSSGLGALVSVLKLLGTGGRLALAGVGAQTRTIFKLTRMDKIFALPASVDEAVASLKG